MTEIIHFNNTKEFIDFNDKVITDNYSVFYSSITSMFSSQIENVYELYNLTDKDGSNAFCLWYSGNYTIHSFKWNDSILDFLSNKINFSKYSHYTFTGQRELLLQLLEMKKVVHEILKDRLVYECCMTNKTLSVKGNLELANLNDIEELSQMSFQYHLDEYGDKAWHDHEHMSKVVRAGVEHKNIYKLVFENKICSMAQVISIGKGNPLIGQLFTKNEFRKKGFASSILFLLTNLLLNDGHKKCGLLSDVKNISSNIVFNKVGYIPIYKQIAVYKNEKG